MKTIAKFACVILAGFGLYKAFTTDFVAGSIMLFLGGISLVIISGDYGQKEHPCYDHDSFMNK